jgi:hypothetical protein
MNKSVSMVSSPSTPHREGLFTSTFAGKGSQGIDMSNDSSLLSGLDDDSEKISISEKLHSKSLRSNGNLVPIVAGSIDEAGMTKSEISFRDEVALQEFGNWGQSYRADNQTVIFPMLSVDEKGPMVSKSPGKSLYHQENWPVAESNYSGEHNESRKVNSNGDKDVYKSFQANGRDLDGNWGKDIAYEYGDGDGDDEVDLAVELQTEESNGKDVMSRRRLPTISNTKPRELPKILQPPPKKLSEKEDEMLTTLLAKESSSSQEPIIKKSRRKIIDEENAGSDDDGHLTELERGFLRAVATGNLEKVRYFLDKGVDVHIKNTFERYVCFSYLHAIVSNVDVCVFL